MNDVLEIFRKMGAKGYGMEVKANEVMHTGNAGYGAEHIPAEVFKQGIIDLIPQRARLLPLLPGNHGSNLPKVLTTGVRGLSIDDLVFQGKNEWTTGTASQTEDDHSQQKAKTKKVTLTQKSFICEVDISDDELRYNAANTEQYVKERIADAAAHTVDLLIINGDNETGGTGNVNSDDGAPAAGSYYLKIDGGIRERAINSSYTVNVGTLAVADYADILSKLGEYAERPEDCLFIQPVKVSAKMKQISEFLTYQNSADRATIQKGIIPTPFGVDVLQHRGVPLTEADGKVSTTPASNTVGQILALYKPAVQYGFGQEFNLEVVRVAGYGFRLVATFDFAFSIVDSDASLTNPTIAAGINVTV